MVIKLKDNLPQLAKNIQDCKERIEKLHREGEEIEKKISDENFDSTLKLQYENRLQEIESEIESLNSRHQILTGKTVAKDPLTELMTNT